MYRPRPLFRRCLHINCCPFCSNRRIRCCDHVRGIIDFVVSRRVARFYNMSPTCAHGLGTVLLCLTSGVPCRIGVTGLSSCLRLGGAAILDCLSDVRHTRLLRLLCASGGSMAGVRGPSGVCIRGPGVLYTLDSRLGVNALHRYFIIGRLSAHRAMRCNGRRNSFGISNGVAFRMNKHSGSFRRVTGLPRSCVLTSNVRRPVNGGLPL